MDDALRSLIGIATLIIVAAIIVVLVKGNGAANLVQSASSAFNTLLGRATKQGA